MQFKQRLKKDASIEIASLVDIVFLLLLFFVVTTTFRESPGLTMELPETTSESGVRLQEVVVKILPRDDSNVIYLLEEEVTLSELPAKLRAMLERMEKEKRSVVVEADKSVRFETVFRVLDIARQAGATNITFPAEFREKTERQR